LSDQVQEIIDQGQGVHLKSRGGEGVQSRGRGDKEWPGPLFAPSHTRARLLHSKQSMEGVLVAYSLPRLFSYFPLFSCSEKSYKFV